MSESPSLFLDAAVLLGGAVIAAPLFKKIGLGTVLGYLFVGIILGPVLNYIHEGEEVLHVGELGVVLLLFLVGLELKPARLWDMRSEIFGLGASQVVASAILIGIVAYLLDLGLNASIVIGFGLALSSTAFAMQMLETSGSKSKPYGRRAFSILLFQDIAIAPLLVMVAVLAAGEMDVSAGALGQIGISVGCLIALILVGRYLLNPLFGIIADTGAREAMIAAALFIVLAAALLMNYAGMSMAMGAFIAGVMLAESSYRHELEADLEPFRGILLGLFFIAVGLSLDLGIVFNNWLLIATLVPLLMLTKALVLYCLCRLFGSDHNQAVQVSSILPQHGEFGFVLFAAASSAALLNAEQASFLIACVVLSMILTPLSVQFGRFLLTSDTAEEMDEDFEGAGTRVLMIGFSRLGQVASQALLAGGCDVTILDNSAARIRNAGQFGFRIYFGDGTRKEVLVSAGIAQAKIVAVCTNHTDTTNKIVTLLKRDFPDVKIYARSYDREHALGLMAEGVEYQIRETFESALSMGRALLVALGHNERDAAAIVDDVRERDLERLKMQSEDGDIRAGQHNLHVRPVPEPLIAPSRKARPIGDETRRALDADDGSAEEAG